MQPTPLGKTFVVFFWMQFASYLNITFDMIAVNHHWYAVASVTNVFAPLIAWMMTHRVAHSEDKATKTVGMIAVALGGWTSTMLGMWLTSHFGAILR